MKNLKFQIAIGIVCLILCFAIPVQLKSITKINNDSIGSNLRVKDLQEELKGLQEKYDRAQKQLDQNNKNLEDLRLAASEKGSAAAAISDQLKHAEMLAGLSDMEGPGVELVMNDSKEPNLNGGNEADFILHDEDLLMVFNELRAAGAEAISINGERVQAMTEVRCAGPTVSINNTKYAPPFIIKAIGDPKTLEAAINLRGGVKEYLTQFKIQLSVKQMDKVLIPRYKGVASFKYGAAVTPAPKKEEKSGKQ